MRRIWNIGVGVLSSLVQSSAAVAGVGMAVHAAEKAHGQAMSPVSTRASTCRLGRAFVLACL